jgi:hypothetical protein
MEMNMRTIVFTMLAVAALTAASPRKADAQYAYPWCAQFTDGSGVFSCAFVTFGQCLATVSGIGGFCVRNPVYTFVLPTNELRRVPTHRRSARR